MSSRVTIAPSILLSTVLYGRIVMECQRPCVSWISCSLIVRESTTSRINVSRSGTLILGLMSEIGRPISVVIRFSALPADALKRLICWFIPDQQDRYIDAA